MLSEGSTSSSLCWLSRQVFPTLPLLNIAKPWISEGAISLPAGTQSLPVAPKTFFGHNLLSGSFTKVLLGQKEQFKRFPLSLFFLLRGRDFSGRTFSHLPILHHVLDWSELINHFPTSEMCLTRWPWLPSRAAAILAAAGKTGGGEAAARTRAGHVPPGDSHVHGPSYDCSYLNLRNRFRKVWQKEGKPQLSPAGATWWVLGFHIAGLWGEWSFGA